MTEISFRVFDQIFFNSVPMSLGIPDPLAFATYANQSSKGLKLVEIFQQTFVLLAQNRIHIQKGKMLLNEPAKVVQ